MTNLLHRDEFSGKINTTHKKLFLLIAIVFTVFSCKTVQNKSTMVLTTTGTINGKNVTDLKPNIVIDKTKNVFGTGADNFAGFEKSVASKRVGVVTNQSGLLLHDQHVIDYLLAKKVNVTKIFAPEHGFRGTADAGELVVDGKDTKTGLPILSLYGDNRKPKAAQLEDLDIIVFDLQDVGARFYTYISTLHNVMEACAENNVSLIILDRPNPNGGIVDGPILEKQWTTFVGMHPIPVLHGMTIGEYAQMINGEKWLQNEVKCDLQVVACSAYDRRIFYDLKVKPSPNLPNAKAINLYASLCFFEGTNVSVGRGTNKQFQIYGSPFITDFSFSFTPLPNEGAKDPIHNGRECFGDDLSTIEPVNKLELKWLLKAYQNTPDKSTFFNQFFTKLAGSKTLQQQIESGLTENEIRETWKDGLKQFKSMRRKYLIYAE
ncbi:MAG: hypothetical protein RLZZ312_1685 [Bacteroidota bacterium]|jgi:uncharacterized protein YbbC (DUF1343 family)